jgi:hypothetical protein
MQTIDETEDDEEYYEEDGLQSMMQHGGKKVIYTVAYFLLLAALMYPSQKMHMGEQGIFFSLVGAGMLLALFVLLFKFVRKKIANMRMTGRQFIQFMVGYHPEVVESTVADDTNQTSPNVTHRLTPAAPPNGRELVTTQRQQLATLEHEDDEDEIPPDSIIEENGLYLSDRFMPSIVGLLGQIILLCGIRRMGKSNLLAVLVEEMARYLLPMLVIDTEDEYSALANRRYLPRGFLAGSKELQAMQQPPLKNYIVVEARNAYSLGRQLLEHSVQVVFNMKSYSTDEEAAWILCEIIRGMNAWEQERPNSERIPVFLFLDEASKWLPEQTGRSVVSKEMQIRLFKTFFGIVVNRGGKNGFACVFATQRIQDINKSALQAPWKFLFYQAQKVDLEQYYTFGLQDQDVLTLRQGECYIFSPQVIGFRTSMRQRFSQHMGHTPGLEALKAHQAKTLRPVQALNFNNPYALPEQIGYHPLEPRADRHQTDQYQYASTASNGTSRTGNHHGDERDRKIGTEEQPVTPQRSGTATTVLTVQGVDVTKKQKLAYDLYVAGNQTIVRLATAMTQNGSCGKVDTNEAYRLRNELEALRLIEVSKRSQE